MFCQGRGKQERRLPEKTEQSASSFENTAMSQLHQPFDWSIVISLYIKYDKEWKCIFFFLKLLYVVHQETSVK